MEKRIYHRLGAFGCRRPLDEDILEGGTVEEGRNACREEANQRIAKDTAGKPWNKDRGGWGSSFPHRPAYDKSSENWRHGHDIRDRFAPTEVRVRHAKGGFPGRTQGGAETGGCAGVGAQASAGKEADEGEGRLVAERLFASRLPFGGASLVLFSWSFYRGIGRTRTVYGSSIHVPRSDANIDAPRTGGASFMTFIL